MLRIGTRCLIHMPSGEVGTPLPNPPDPTGTQKGHLPHESGSGPPGRRGLPSFLFMAGPPGYPASEPRAARAPAKATFGSV